MICHNTFKPKDEPKQGTSHFSQLNLLTLLLLNGNQHLC